MTTVLTEKEKISEEKNKVFGGIQKHKKAKPV
jgi:hypothetical protein